LVACTAAAAGALALVAAAMPAANRSGETFTIRGSAEQLYPGARVPLTLHVRNPNARLIKVLSLTIEVEDASRSCAASNLRVSRYRWPFRVRGRGTRTIELWATLAESAPLACRGARFPLTYSGHAVRP
jgi:hypothetical protein